MRKGTRKQIEEPIINLTPLIDVVFVILFTFIIVAPLLEIDRVTLAPGKGGKESVFENALITIHVYSDNSLSLNKKKVNLTTLPSELKALKTTSQKVQVFHDAQARFGTFQQIKNILENEGFLEMDVVLQP